ncbi:hypothetical protein WJ972_10745 [Achromobacter insuavis]
MEAQLRGYGMTGGGTLTIERDGVVQIGGAREAAADGALWLDPAMLRTGFSHYDINGRGGLRVAPGVVLEVAAPVYRYAAPGADAAALPQLWLPPEYQDDPVKARLTPRAGARDLTLRSQRIEDGADIVIGAGARVTVDPGRAIRLLGGGNSRITVDGTLRRAAAASRSTSWRRIATGATAPRPRRTTAPSGSAAAPCWTCPARRRARSTRRACATAGRRPAAAFCWVARSTGTPAAPPPTRATSPS